MFLCEDCSPKGFQSFLQSRGKCEDCGKLRACNDVPKDMLPMPDEAPKTPAPAEGARQWNDSQQHAIALLKDCIDLGKRRNALDDSSPHSEVRDVLAEQAAIHGQLPMWAATILDMIPSAAPATPAPEGREPQFKAGDGGWHIGGRNGLARRQANGIWFYKLNDGTEGYCNYREDAERCIDDMPTPPAQPPVTGQELRLLAMNHEETCCPDPKYACGACKREADKLRELADYLDQRQAERPRVTRDELTELCDGKFERFIARLRELGIDVED